MSVLQQGDLAQFAIKGSEVDWDKALQSGKQGLVSVKRYQTVCAELGQIL